MPETSVDVDVKSKGDMVIDHLTSKLGIFNKEGLAMGVAFAGVNIAVGLVQQGISGLIGYIEDGVEKNREFQLSLADVSNSMREWDTTSLASIRNDLIDLSIVFGRDVNTLTEGLRDFLKAGYDASDSLQMLYQTEKFAMVSGDDLQTTNEAVIQSLDVFGLSSLNAGYSVDELNRMLSTTRLTVSDYSNLLGMNIDAVQAAGLSFNDFVNILIELDHEGNRGRGVMTALRDVLQDYPELYTMVENAAKSQGDAVTSINDKYKTLTSTTQLTQDQLTQLGEAYKMNLTGGVDIGGMFNTEQMHAALSEIDTLRSKGVTTLTEFNTLQKEAQDAGFGTFLTPAQSEVSIVSSLNDEFEQLVRSILYFNEQQEKAAGASAPAYLERLSAGIKTNIALLDPLNQSIATHNKAIGDIGMEERRITAVHYLNTQLHFLDLGLKDASYADKIMDTQTASLVDSLRMQQEAIDSLTQKDEEYSLQSNENSLEMMKIQYEADEHHGRMTRAQRKRLEELQHANDLLRINTLENQNSIDQTRLDMTPEEKRLDAIKTHMGEELYAYQDTYGKEIESLQTSLTTEQGLLADDILARKQAQDTILENTRRFHNAEALIAQTGGLITGSQLEGWLGSDVVPPGWGLYQGRLIPPSQTGSYRGREGYQQYHVGGDVLETGLALVRRGERITPPGGVSPNPIIQRTVGPHIVNVYLHVENADNLDRFARKFGEAIGSGLITGDIQSIYHFKG